MEALRNLKYKNPVKNKMQTGNDEIIKSDMEICIRATLSGYESLLMYYSTIFGKRQTI